MHDIEIVSNPISLSRLKEVAQKRFGDMIKCVADVEKHVIAIGGELHADEEAVLLDQGSRQSDLWGFNIYVDQPRNSWIEFDSMINLRPAQGNRSRSVENTEIQNKIKDIVNRFIV